MMCDCRTRVDGHLKDRNARLVVGFIATGSTLDLSPPLIAIEKINPRGKKPPHLVASYCPFCGEHLTKETKTSDIPVHRIGETEQ